MLFELIGLGVSAVTSGVKKSAANVQSINDQLTQKKLDELVSAGVLTVNDQGEYVQTVKNDSGNKSVFLIIAAVLAAILIFKK